MKKQHWKLVALPALALAPVLIGGPTSSASTAPPSTPPGSEAAATGSPEYRDAELEFGPAPPAFPTGAGMAVIAGDPTAEGGVFTVRLLFPDGYVIPAHWHPTDEHITVIRGEFLVGLGDAFDEAALLPALQPGDFITAPAHVNHFAMAQGETEVQVHAVGPFAMTYVDPADDPRNQ